MCCVFIELILHSVFCVLPAGFLLLVDRHFQNQVSEFFLFKITVYFLLLRSSLNCVLHALNLKGLFHHEEWCDFSLQRRGDPWEMRRRCSSLFVLSASHHRPAGGCGSFICGHRSAGQLLRQPARWVLRSEVRWWNSGLSFSSSVKLSFSCLMSWRIECFGHDRCFF